MNRIIHVPKALAIAAVLVSLSACGSHTPKDENISTGPDDAVNQQAMSVVKSTDSVLKEDKTMILTGQILYKTFEGGFYGFEANDGQKYTPSGLSEEHRKHGLIVEMKVTPLTDRMTTTQFGTLVKVLEVKVLDASKVTDINQTM